MNIDMKIYELLREEEAVYEVALSDLPPKLHYREARGARVNSTKSTFSVDGTIIKDFKNYLLVYPDTARIQFGQTIVFDRLHWKAQMPVLYTSHQEIPLKLTIATH